MWKFFESLNPRPPSPCIVECISIYIFCFKKTKHKFKQKVKETKNEKRKTKETTKDKKKENAVANSIWENLTGFIYSLPICCVLSTYVIKSWIFPHCSHEFNLNYAQGEKSQYLLYYNNIWVQTFKNKNKRKLLRDIFVYHSLFYIFIHGCKFVIIETCSYIIAHYENVMS